MRFDAYAIYKGIEFEVDELDDGRFKLYSRGKPFENLGFEETSTHGVFTKIVTRKEIETAYGIDNFARYKGYNFGISIRSRFKEKENKIMLISSRKSIAEKLGMEMAEQSIYEKWINIDEAEQIWEERKPIYGFQLPNWIKPLEVIKRK